MEKRCSRSSLLNASKLTPTRSRSRLTYVFRTRRLEIMPYLILNIRIDDPNSLPDISEAVLVLPISSSKYQLSSQITNISLTPKHPNQYPNHCKSLIRQDIKPSNFMRLFKGIVSIPHLFISTTIPYPHPSFQIPFILHFSSSIVSLLFCLIIPHHPPPSQFPSSNQETSLRTPLSPTAPSPRNTCFPLQKQLFPKYNSNMLRAVFQQYSSLEMRKDL